MDLRVREFSSDDLAKVQGFDCGPEPWARAAASWIQNAPPFLSALLSMQQHPENKVWLYYCCIDLGSSPGGSVSVESRSSELAEEYIVGFSSLGTTTWRIPPPDGDRRTLGYIPMLALASGFQGKLCDSGRRYSDLIMEHLIAASQERGFREVGLLVDPDNQKALCLYRRFGFADAGRYKRNLCMVKVLEG